METFTTAQPVIVPSEITSDKAAEPKRKQLRGFAILDENKRKEIARKGGKTAHALGKAHRFSKEEAKVAGQKGGRSRRTVPKSRAS